MSSVRRLSWQRKHFRRTTIKLSRLTWESSTLRLLAWEERRPRLDQEVCEEVPASARRGERSVVHLRRMMTQLRDGKSSPNSYWMPTAGRSSQYWDWPVESVAGHQPSQPQADRYQLSSATSRPAMQILSQSFPWLAGTARELQGREEENINPSNISSPPWIENISFRINLNDTP